MNVQHGRLGFYVYVYYPFHLAALWILGLAA
jgi:hypothetical protein